MSTNQKIKISIYKCRVFVFVAPALVNVVLLHYYSRYLFTVPEYSSNSNSGDMSSVSYVNTTTVSSYILTRTLGNSKRDKRIWPVDDIMPTDNVKEYFKNTLLIVVMSPSRYHLVSEVRKHYSIFFCRIFFFGPKNSTQYGITIRGYKIMRGNEMYRAVSRILREYYMREDERSRSGKVRGMLKRGLDSAKGDDGLPTYNNSTNDHCIDSEMTKPTHTTPMKDLIDGMLFVSDDTILQPWALAAKGFNKSIPWANQMGIGNSRRYRILTTVPGMDVEYHHPMGQKGKMWPQKNFEFRQLRKVLSKAGKAFRNRLALAAQATPVHVFIWSGEEIPNKAPYSDRNIVNEKNENGVKELLIKAKNMNSSVINKRFKWSIFYTIVDAYYVPRPMWGEYCEVADLMAKYHVFHELAIPTLLRSLHPTYEEMDVQYYWKTHSSAICPREMWNINKVDGIHRCRHDHEFVHAIYSSHLFRKMILNDENVRFQVTNLSKLRSVKYEVSK